MAKPKSANPARIADMMREAEEKLEKLILPGILQYEAETGITVLSIDLRNHGDDNPLVDVVFVVPRGEK